GLRPCPGRQARPALGRRILWMSRPLARTRPVDARPPCTGAHRLLATASRPGQPVPMRTPGLVPRFEKNGDVGSAGIDAESTQPALDVFRAPFGPARGPDDLPEGNRLGDRSLETITWGHWQSLNPITVIGAQDLRTTADAAQPGTESEPA